ncbi:Uncharacterised protein [[Eubacterium] contortum]|uniref:IrrE N-terminal-like domain-containing protein n=1 Tax=Faecalicatena contorta TaxID=39482 RepID=A0A174N1A3_9FIRM|nr:hypothetical protein [Faecalicatena contorta]CUP40687.1 Uncharacterised protein [[Eubacterium] contortum] [Faecalicatena contorta]
MNTYEVLLDEAYNKGLTVKEKPLQSSNGRIRGRKIAIREDIATNKEKACVLAEEIGHFHTGVGHIINQADIGNCKEERKGRLWAYNDRIGLNGLISAYNYGCKSLYEIADYLEVTEDFLEECIDCYRDKYGVATTIDNYCIIFIPHLMVGKIVN